MCTRAPLVVASCCAYVTSQEIRRYERALRRYARARSDALAAPPTCNTKLDLRHPLLTRIGYRAFHISELQEVWLPGTLHTNAAIAFRDGTFITH